MSITNNSAWKTRLVESDLDVWVHHSRPNSEKLVGALNKFGAPLENDGISGETFTKQVVYPIGIAPVPIDILTEITGVEFSDAWRRRVASTFFGVPVHFISREDLITNKRAVSRSSDLKDLNQQRSKTRIGSADDPLGRWQNTTVGRRS